MPSAEDFELMREARLWGVVQCEQQYSNLFEHQDSELMGGTLNEGGLVMKHSRTVIVKFRSKDG